MGISVGADASTEGAVGVASNANMSLNEQAVKERVKIILRIIFFINVYLNKLYTYKNICTQSLETCNPKMLGKI